MPRAGPALLAAALLLAEPSYALRYETPPIVRSSRVLLPLTPLAGERYRVLDRVENDGFMNRWRIASDWGEFEAESDAMLEVRLREVEALTQLHEVTRTEAFVDAMEKALTGKFKAARRVVEHPIATARAVPAGVTRLFRRKRRQVRDLSEEAREEVREIREDAQERQAERAEGEKGADAPGEVDPERRREARRERRARKVEAGKEVAKDVGKEAQRFFQRKSGYRRARRYWAKSLGVDPYGDNEPLNRELFRVAAASAAGGLSMRFLVPLPVIPGLARLTDVKELVYDLDALDLRLRNEQVLFALGFERPEVDALYESRPWSATLITDLADALSSLRSVPDLELLLNWALEAEEAADARFQAAVIGYFAYLHQRGWPIARFHDGDAVVSAVLAEGRVVTAMAVDHLAWTEEWEAIWAGELASLRAAGDGRVELHLRGSCSELAQRRMAEQRVGVLERAF